MNIMTFDNDNNFSFNSLYYSKFDEHTPTPYTPIYTCNAHQLAIMALGKNAIYIYIYICVCVCVYCKCRCG